MNHVGTYDNSDAATQLEAVNTFATRYYGSRRWNLLRPSGVCEIPFTQPLNSGPVDDIDLCRSYNTEVGECKNKATHAVILNDGSMHDSCEFHAVTVTKNWYPGIMEVKENNAISEFHEA